jgi:2-oxoglutarate ferredoxin oxidoreductase subunit beta
MASFINCFGLHSLHGRAIPTAIGAKLANHNMPILVIGGDGDLLGEGLSHMIHAARENHDITVILHNNQVYGLTTGQASPTTLRGAKTKTTPEGVLGVPLDPSALAILNDAGFVARGFAGDMPHLTSLIVAGLQHRGFSLIEVLQPCVTFNRLNTYEWFRQRIKKLELEGSDLSGRSDPYAALKLAEWTDETIHTGILYRNNRPAYHTLASPLNDKPLVETTGQKRDIAQLLQRFR